MEPTIPHEVAMPQDRGSGRDLLRWGKARVGGCLVEVDEMEVRTA